ncbi:hypothetical protein POF50_012510 [Streptomyces sp. SL13]|jgi:hypothetical protein|uniref:Uncharacterized protein n=1 Tax=Streptantibioticus silvisoli TaxID=2705255 RepID=A0AA90K904_9ACTN|nr:hypothetical protein [Streptantibioticus silvisoli]MDI5967509.1 hypothetical protein [Streptantibioticus silvisoli]MDI5970152.1 hypothetical protein [Streptantibioticus silvisoli]
MDGIAPSVIAVLGTLLGVGLTYVFQERGNARIAQQDREERLRQERMDAYVAYAAALVAYRRGLIDLWFSDRAGTPPEELRRVRLHSYELRTAAQEALFRVQLVTDDAVLSTRAVQVFQEVGEVGRSDQREEMDRRRESTRDAVNAFVTTVRPMVMPRSTD